jgi:hypothetical protein
VIRVCVEGAAKAGSGDTESGGRDVCRPSGARSLLWMLNPGLTPGANDARPLRGLGGGEEAGIEASSHQAIEWEAEEGKASRHPAIKPSSGRQRKGRHRGIQPSSHRVGGRGGEGIEASSHQAIEWEAEEAGAGKRETHGPRTLDRGTRHGARGLGRGTPKIRLCIEDAAKAASGTRGRGGMQIGRHEDTRPSHARPWHPEGGGTTGCKPVPLSGWGVVA